MHAKFVSHINGIDFFDLRNCNAALYCSSYGLHNAKASVSLFLINSDRDVAVIKCG